MHAAPGKPPWGPESSSGGFLRILWLGTSMVLLLVGLLVGFTQTQSLGRHRRQSELKARNRAEVIEQTLANSLKILELSLATAEEEYRRLRSQARFDEAGFQAYLLRMYGRLPPFLEGLRVADSDGRVRFGNGLNPGAPVSIADREYFLQLKRDPRAGLVVSKPVLGRVSQRWVIIFARRVTGPTGAFEGVVYATVLLDQFTKIFAGMELGPRGEAILRDPGDTIIARHPLSPELGGISGVKPPPRPFQDMVEAKKTEALYTVTGVVDRVERTYAVRKIGNHPLYLLVGLSTRDFMEEWRNEAQRLGLLYLLFVVVTVTGTALLHRSWRNQQEALHAMVRQEHRFRMLFESAGDAIFIQDLEGRLLEVNQAGMERMGMSAPQVPGAGTRLNVPDIHHLLEGQEEVIFQTALAGPGGDLLQVEIRSRRVEYEGRPAILSIARDLSERRRVDILKEEFISLVSHELRTPLTAIRGSIGLLMGGVGGELSEQGKLLVDTALRNTEQLVRIVNDLLDLQAMERGMLPVSLVEVELGDLVKESIRAQVPYGHLFEVTYALEAPPEPLRVLGDPLRLQQIMANLLSNATKYSPAGGVVKVRLKGLPDRARVEVEDAGPGIPEAFHSRVFHKFAQSQVGNTRQTSGTGLGLSIAKAIVELHHGTIGFTCPPEGGTLFWFELPPKPS